MKTTAHALIIFLGIIILGACSNPEPPKTELPQTPEIQDFTESFDGTISSYPVIMTLSKKGNELTGTYTYKKKGLTFRVNGEIDSLGNLMINEFSDKGSITGVFKGQYSEDRIIGNWQRPDGSGIIPFSLVKSALNEADFMKPQLDLTKLAGNYFIGSKSLMIRGNVSDGFIRFELSVGTENCMGDLTGIANITQSGESAIYQSSEDGCIITFSFKPEGIVVEEMACDYWHGMTCNFNGKYKKR